MDRKFKALAGQGRKDAWEIDGSTVLPNHKLAPLLHILHFIKDLEVLDFSDIKVALCLKVKSNIDPVCLHGSHHTPGIVFLWYLNDFT